MFMWIAGRQRLDFRTINRFRSGRMKSILEASSPLFSNFLWNQAM